MVKPLAPAQATTAGFTLMVIQVEAEQPTKSFTVTQYVEVLSGVAIGSGILIPLRPLPGAQV